jgi:hypothetical protein
MNVIVLLAATAITTTFFSFAPVTAAQGKQFSASAGSEDVSARRQKRQCLLRCYHRKREILPQTCSGVIFPRSPVCGPLPFTLYPFVY